MIRLGLSALISMVVAGFSGAESPVVDVKMVLLKPSAGVKLPADTLTTLPRGKSFEARVLKSLDLSGSTLEEASETLAVVSRPSIRAHAGEAAELAIGAQVPYTSGHRVENTGVLVTEFADIGLKVNVTCTPIAGSDEMQLNLALDTSEKVESEETQSTVVLKRAATEVHCRIKRGKDVMISTEDALGVPLLLALDIEESEDTATGD